jgi:hypothetical protein
MYQDNQPAITLAQAPAIPARSRHIAQRHHFIRWLYSTGQISSITKAQNDIAPDGMTKSVAPIDFFTCDRLVQLDRLTTSTSPNPLPVF